MSNNGTAIASRTKPTDLVTIKILLNGRPISGEYKITGLDISTGFNKISSARITIADGDPARQEFAISSKEDGLKPGADIEISLGYHADTKTVFKGIIIRHAIKSGKNKPSFLTIEAKDKAIKLALTRNNRCFSEMTDTDIIKAVIGKSAYNGNVEIGATGLSHKEMVQYNALDWDFIVCRAEMNGMLVLAAENKLVINAPDTSKSPTKELTYGIDIIEFESELDAVSQIDHVTSLSWSYKDQKVEESGEASISFKENGNLNGKALASALGLNQYQLVHPGNLNAEELKSWSESALLKSRLAKNIGHIKVQGTTEIIPGNVIGLKGFSDRFNGNVLVTAISHSYYGSVWETDIQFGLPARFFYKHEEIVEKPASGLVPGVNGLQIGVVLQNESDPEQQDRVKVRLPLVDASEGLWARMASLDAGKDRGSFFRPEINDEVIVGFLNDDPRYPVILGMLNSSSSPAPLKGSDDNHEKGFVTRSKMKFVFNDDKKSITIDTPKGKKVEINDDGDSMTFSDQHNNKIILDSKGITLESGKDVSIKAAAGNISMNGINVEAKANAKFSAEGSANASLQSSGPTIVKGAIVNIN
ncbi:type VI secretion system tip protein VgrG [Segetibacter sp. 3557_3]|uniref:type VI secretion system tip protein VgrG n=1 Tax=Segetibacter sp. 3557_3 TaxID=2547429 RepID=UPI001058F177|nr:type VI secretion system tip protein VgrG [Segetibacter sp. 3557_3]TDH27261.1 type VI secretion system tip protein VgrG [Segetibacter sp. 3557_3]